MLNTKLLLFFLFSSLLAYGQTRTFLKQVEELFYIQDSVMEISHLTASNSFHDFQAHGFKTIEDQLLWYLNRKGRVCKDEIKQSKTLQIMAEISIVSWRGTQYSDSKKWAKLNRYFKRVSRLNRKQFHEILSSSCRIELVNRKGKKFFYLRDEDNPEGLNLYFGEKPSNKELEEGVDLEPLPLFTEKELIDQIEKKIKTSKMFRHLRRGNLSFLGLKIELDERTLYKNKIPTARVVILAGARRQVRTIKID